MNPVSRLSFGFRRPLPVILQTEVAECGLACLAMVASYHGHRIDLGALRRRFSASMKGLSLIDISRFASGLSLAARAVRIELEELVNLRLPCILHWKLRHYVVLERVTSKGAIINDPAVGRRHIPHSEISEYFSGIALELWPTGGFEKKTERDRIRLSDLFRRVVGLKRALAQIFLLSLCLESFALLAPIGSQVIFDEVIVAADHDLLTVVAVTLGALLLLQTMTGLARSWATLIMGTSLSVQWTAALFDHLLRLPLSYFEKRHIGDIVSRFGSLGRIQSAITTDLVGAVLDGIMAVGALAMMLLYGGWLTIVAIVTIALHLLVRIVAYRPYRDANEAAIIQGAKEDSHFMETIRGVASIKALDLHEKRRGAWLNLLIEATNANLRIQKLDFVFGTIGGLLSGADGIIMLVLGTRAVLAGDMTLGMLVAFLAYKDQFVGRVSALIGLAISLKMLGLHAERIADIALAAPEEDATRIFPAPTPRSSPAHLTLRDISFSYGEGLADVLHGIDLEVIPGECVAIVGPSGCGKTTLLKIMSGLITPTGGKVFVDGEDINSVGLTNYRRMTATVLQEDRLFAGTIAENIALFDHEADQSWIEECARMAAIADEIDAMPMRYDSLVGDMGSTLSGGQKQRLFLARALYRKPRILFLDEATSDLDESNEQKINNAVAALAISRVIVAHRPSTIALAERHITLAAPTERKLLQL
ncbi:ABC transporter [Paramesorhizobium deserti]|uniref:ABC transporter n=1 Tax=Paramesorhizobium deserti TaxID=1494590 RepID=A0A135HXM4_9HYPH|nr:peptidase domain-containing ABC transporter [Paramesorhizobium deserti]KXF77954.1 ABC transporter [Paramesorhizobium deserti]